MRIADLPRLVQLLRRLHAAGRLEEEQPVFVTEYGYETNPPDPLQPVSPEQQARYLPAAERIATQTDGVASFAQFLLRDLGPREGAETPRARWGDFQSGLRFPDGRPKPAERAFTLALAARAEEGGVSFWVRVRGAEKPRRVRISRRSRDEFEPVGEPFETDAAGYAERLLEVSPAGEYRVEVEEDGRWTPGSAIPVRR